MLLYLFFLFTLIPLVELWLLFQLSGWFGFWTTLAVVLGTGFVGAALAKWQGWLAIHRVQNEMRQGLLPAQALGDSVLILVAGVLLITPGVLTDIFGLALLIPPFRTGVRKVLQAWLAKRVRLEATAFREAADRAGDQVVEGKVVHAHVVEPTPESLPQ